MKDLFIIFAENGKLKNCVKFHHEIDNTLVTQEFTMCFLNGKRSVQPILDAGELAGQSGVLLVYDAPSDIAYDKEKTIASLQDISKRYDRLYICYHESSYEHWQEDISRLEIAWAKKPIKKHHGDKPYSLLDGFHESTLQIDHLEEFFHQEEVNALKGKRYELLGALQSARTAKRANHLEYSGVLEIVREAELNEDLNAQYEYLKTLVEKARDPVWKKALEKLKKSIDEDAVKAISMYTI